MFVTMLLSRQCHWDLMTFLHQLWQIHLTPPLTAWVYFSIVRVTRVGFLWVIILFITCMLIANSSLVTILIHDHKQMKHVRLQAGSLPFKCYWATSQNCNKTYDNNFNRARVRATYSPFMFSLVLQLVLSY